MKTWKLEIYLAPAKGSLDDFFSPEDQEVAAKFGWLGFTLRRLVDGKWIVEDECVGFPPTLQVDQCLDYCEIASLDDLAWSKAKANDENEIEIIDSRPRAMWDLSHKLLDQT